MGRYWLILNFFIVFYLVQRLQLCRQKGVLNENFFEEDRELYLLGTEDGYFSAFRRNLRDLKWRISLGSPLIEVNINFKNITLEDKTILPGGDGALYLANTEDNSIEKLDADLKSLIDKSPFTLPIMQNHIFLGDKLTTTFLIDVKEGNILSKTSSNQTNFNMFKNNTNNFDENNHQRITVIRTDYTLSSFLQNTSNLQWNLTVSEVLVINQDEDEIDKPHERDKSVHNKSKLSFLLKEAEADGRLNSKVAFIIKYTKLKKTPYKFYSTSNEDNHITKLTSSSNNKFTSQIREYIKRIMTKTKQETEFYMFINSNFMNAYTLLILILSAFCILACGCFFKIYKDNLELNKQILILKEKEITKIKVGLKGTDNFSARSTNTKLDKSLDSNHETEELDHSEQEERDYYNDYKYKNYDLVTSKYNIIKDNFEGKYDDYESETSNHKREIIKNELENEYSNNFDYKLEEYDTLRNQEERSLNSIRTLKTEKSQKSQKSQKSLHSCLSSRSKISKASECKLEKIKSEEDFTEKANLPFLKETFKFNYKKTDMSSVTECIVEEDENKIKKTELRKIITIYEKGREKGKRTQSFDETKRNTSVMKFNFDNVSMKFNVNAKLTKEDFKVCWEKTDFGVFNKEIDLDLIKLNSECEERQIQRYHSDQIKSKRNFTINEENKNELVSLQKTYLESTKSRLGLNQNREEDSILTKKDISFTRKNQEIYKILNDFENEDSSGNEASSLDNESNSLEMEMYKIQAESQLRDNMNKNYFDTGRFIKNFEEIKIIGKGGFGCVFKAKHKIDGSEYAIKIIKLKITPQENLSEQEVVKEIKMMMKLHHKNVVRYITCWFELDEFNNSQHKVKKTRSKSINTYEEASSLINRGKQKKPSRFSKGNNNRFSSVNQENSEDDYDFDSDKYNKYSVMFEKKGEEEGEIIDVISKVKDDITINQSNRKLKITSNHKFTVYFYMQIEYCQGFPLSYYLENRRSETEEVLIFYMFSQILSAVNHIHQHHIIHRDLKPANIFIHGNFNLKIGDFGLATFANKSSTTDQEIKENVGTPLYQSPEQIEGKPYDEKVDIYSLGIILIELCTFFKTQSERRIVLENVRNTSLIPLTILNKSPTLYNLSQLMTQRDPAKRPGTQEILTSPEYRSMASAYDCVEVEE